MRGPVTITTRSIHHYLIPCHSGMLLLDPGWAGSLAELSGGFRRYGIEPRTVRYVMFTHHHPDHAGLTQEVKRAWGARLLIHERQIPYLQELESFHQRKGGYVPIVVEPDDVVVTGDLGRAALKAIGIDGELVETPGHSEDSVSLVLDSGMAFIGDLHVPGMAGESLLAAACESWRTLMGLNVHTAYPAHAEPFPLSALDMDLC